MIDKTKCIGCGSCIEICPVGALSFGEDGLAQVDETKCIKCGYCQDTCPVEAIKIDVRG